MSRWTEYNPDTGLTEVNVADEEAGTITVHKMQDVQPLLDRNAEVRNTKATDAGIKKGLWCYMSIPPTVQYEMLTKHGVNIHNRNHWPRVWNLVNTEYPACKTTDKHHSLKGGGKSYAVTSPKRKSLPKKATLIVPGNTATSI